MDELYHLSAKLRRRLRASFALYLLMIATVAVAGAAAAPATEEAATQSTTAPATIPAAPQAPVKSYSQTEIASQAESTAAELESVNRQLQTHSRIDSVEAQLPGLTQEVASREAESNRVISPSVSIDLLRTLDRDWEPIRAQLDFWQTDLRDRGDDLAKISQRLAALQQNWSVTLQTLQQASAPPELIDRLQQLVKNIGRAQDSAVQQQAVVAMLFGRVNAQDVRVTDAVLNVRRAQQRAFSRLTSRDSPPLWDSFSRATWTAAGNTLAQQGADSLSTQAANLRSYVENAVGSLLIHLAVVLSITALLIWLRPYVQQPLQLDDRARCAAVIFELPLMTAFVLSMIASIWIYPQAPRLFWAILGITALMPILIVLRRMVDAKLRPLLYVLVIFSILGLLQSVLASLPLLSRWLYLIEMGGTAAFNVLYLIHRSKQTAGTQNQPVLPGLQPPSAPQPTIVTPGGAFGWKGIALALRAATALTIISAIANVLGYVALAKLLAGGLLTSAYLAMLLHAGVGVADALLLGAMNLRPLILLRMVRDRGATIRLWIYRLLVLGATVFWIWLTLDSLSIRQPILSKMWAILAAEWRPGPFRISLGGVLAFALTVAGAFVLSRFARFMLEEDIYPRVRLGRGIPYAISTVLHYAILLFGFLAAISTIYDLTQFTILASAFGVGLGFGMQNIVNNFVSGLILLFERPVQVGDVIEIAGNIGTVIRIGIRASVVTTLESAEIIIPNGQLISDRVTNWTLSNRKRGLTIPLVLRRSDDPQRAMDLLVAVAKATPGVAERPTPTAVIAAMNATSFAYELRLSISSFEDWAAARSKLLKAINESLEQNGLAMV